MTIEREDFDAAVYNEFVAAWSADEWKARAEAAEQAAADCRKERARYGDIATERMGALENEAERLRLELAAAQAEITAAQNETVWLRDALDGECALDEAERAKAEVERLREQVATLANLLDQAAALYADDWPTNFIDEVQATLEAANTSQDAA